MKKTRFILFLSALLVFFSSFAFAQPAKRKHAHRAIRKTAVVLLYAHKQVKQNKVYTGNLARAVRHQRYARFLFHKGKFVRALHHTRRARMLAFVAINANKGTVSKEWETNKEENQGAPDDKELEKELPAETASLTDEQLILQELTDVDLEEAIKDK